MSDPAQTSNVDEKLTSINEIIAKIKHASGGSKEAPRPVNSERSGEVQASTELAPKIEKVATPEMSVDLQESISVAESEKIKETSAEIQKFVREQSKANDKRGQGVTIDINTVQDGVDYQNPPTLVTSLTKEEFENEQKASPKLGIRWLIEETKKLLEKFKAKLVFADSKPTPAEKQTTEKGI